MSIHTFLLMAATLLVSMHGQAGIIAAWDMQGQPGNQLDMAASSVAEGASNATLYRGEGLTATSASGAFSSAGWSGSEAGDYIGLILDISESYQLQLDSLQLATRSSNTGPGTLGLFSSLDGFARQIGSFIQNGSAILSSTIDLSSLGTLQGALEFRLFELGNTQADGSGATSTAGTFRLLNSDSGFIRLEGTLAAMPGEVPAPATFWLLLPALAALAVLRRPVPQHRGAPG